MMATSTNSWSVPYQIDNGRLHRSAASLWWSARMVEPNYSLVAPGYESEESRCDGVDSDCDGISDERIFWSAL